MSDVRSRRRNTVLAGLEAARRRYPEMSLKGLAAFLYVAENPGIQMVEVAEVMDVLLPTASRVVRALCDEASPGALAPCLGLLQLQRSQEGGAARRLVLTDAGRRLVAELDRIIERPQTIQVKDRPKLELIANR